MSLHTDPSIAAAVLMVVKFVQYFRAGRASRVASVLFRDGFMEFTGMSPKQEVDFLVTEAYTFERGQIGRAHV